MQGAENPGTSAYVLLPLMFVHTQSDLGQGMQSDVGVLLWASGHKEDLSDSEL